MTLNYDETPIPFEHLDGRMYATKGSHTVGGKSDRSGWNKRQATLILYIFADGIHRIPLKIIFGNQLKLEVGLKLMRVYFITSTSAPKAPRKDLIRCIRSLMRHQVPLRELVFQYSHNSR